MTPKSENILNNKKGVVPFLKKRWILVLITLGVIGFFAIQNKNGNGVEEAIVQRGSIKEELILTGEIVADEHAKLTFATSGKTAYVGVKEGEIVKKGTLLTKLDTSNLNSDFERAKADLRSAEASVQKVHDDLKDAGSAETYTQKETRTVAEVSKDKAYEAYLKALENLSGASLFAPFDGTVTYVANSFIGVNVLATQTQIEMVNPKTIHFVVAADQTEVTQLSEGQNVDVVLDSFLATSFTATIDSISLTPSTDEAGTVYKVRLIFSDPALSGVDFRVGMTGDAHFTVKQKSDALFVFSKFVNSDKDGDFVFLNQKDNRVPVEIGIEGEENTEIIGDIKEGDKVFD